MKKKIKIWCPSIIIGFVLILTNSCEKDENKVEVDNKINFNPSITYSTMTDQDGNTYKTVTIGNQTWMAENLRTTKYRNGDTIPNVTDTTQWGNLTIGAYCNYDNIAANAPTYGRLYNWFALKDSRSIAPSGWHVPNEMENGRL